MNTTINEAISRKRKTDITNPISRKTHLISKRTNRYTTTVAMSDHTTALTFVSNHTHTTVHTNLSTNFMLIPEARLFFCFVLSFLFSMTFFLFFAASVRSAVFCFVLAAKGQRGDEDKFFALNTLARRERGRFRAKPFRA
ncbi:hypothetical protein M2133_002567 [Parabacteroides sp. PF5-6]|nr:hypothetical protein [Parabacteroides sp. PF5-6]